MKLIVWRFQWELHSGYGTGTVLVILVNYLCHKVEVLLLVSSPEHYLNSTISMLRDNKLQLNPDRAEVLVVRKKTDVEIQERLAALLLKGQNCNLECCLALQVILDLQVRTHFQSTTNTPKQFLATVSPYFGHNLA